MINNLHCTIGWLAVNNSTQFTVLRFIVRSMASIKTFVFLDSETTGLPSAENNKTKITELCLTAVESEHIGLGVYPRVQNKLSLCFNPFKIIHPIATEVTGLSNDLLQHQSLFTYETVELIKNFLQMQKSPVCFVAHNGDFFDYPILRTHIHNTQNSIPDDVLCIDSLTAFREMYLEKNVANNVSANSGNEGNNKTNFRNITSIDTIPIEFQDGFDELLSHAVDEIEKALPKKRTIDEIQKSNETTPMKKMNVDNTVNGTTKGKKQPHIRPISACVKRLFPVGVSFKLTDVYTRTTGKKPTDAHWAENDVSMLIEIAATLGDPFVDWANRNAKKFAEIPLMRPGRKLGT